MHELELVILSRSPSSLGYELSLWRNTIYSPNHLYLAYCYDNCINVLDMVREKLVHHFVTPYTKICIDYSPDFRYIISGQSDGHIYIWDLSNGCNTVLIDTSSCIRNIQVVPNEKYHMLTKYYNMMT
jgi:WD40 repeat protein